MPIIGCHSSHLSADRTPQRPRVRGTRFVTAKLSGVRVEEFGFGYPPRILKLGTWRETTISLNMLPVGGFVRMAEDDPTIEGSLANKGRTTRALVYSAGAMMNLVLAIVLYSTTFMIGTLTPVQAPGAGIYYVQPESPAELAGLKPGDTIIAIDDLAIQDASHASDLIKVGAGSSIEITVRRNGQVLSPIPITPRLNPPEGQGALGVGLDLPLVKRSYPVWQAVPLGCQATYDTVRGMFYGIRAAIRKEIAFEVSGPIGIYYTTVEVAKSGLGQLIEFTAFLSLNLFLINLLPLPALDGGRLIFILIELVRRGKRVSPEKEGFVHAMGMVFLLAMMAVVAFIDYQRYFG